MLHNKKGMTLAELMVAMGLLVLIVFCFTPLMLTSFKSVMMANTMQNESYNGKGQIEQDIATGLTSTTLTEDQVKVTFQQESKADQKTGAQGTYVRDKNNILTSFLGRDEAQMQLAPTSISENCPSNTVIKISSDYAAFLDYNKFKITINNIPYTNANTNIAFAADNDDPANMNKAQLTIKNSAALGLQMGVPCIISYNDGMSSTLRVTLPSLIAVGNNGAILSRRSDGVWQKSRCNQVSSDLYKLGINTLNAAVWTGQQYVAVGENGAFYFTPDEESWNRNDTFSSSSNMIFTDIAASENSGNLYLTGYQKKVNSTPEKGYRAELGTNPEDDLPKTLDGAVNRYTAVGVGTENMADKLYWASYVTNTISTTEKQLVALINDLSISSKTVQASDASSNNEISSIVWNGHSNYTASSADGHTYKNESGSAQWIPNTNTNVIMPGEAPGQPLDYWVYTDVRDENNKTASVKAFAADITVSGEKYILVKQSDGTQKKYTLVKGIFGWGATSRYHYQVQMQYATSEAQLSGGDFKTAEYGSNTDKTLVVGGQLRLSAEGKYVPISDGKVETTYLTRFSGWQNFLGTTEEMTDVSAEGLDNPYPLLYQDKAGVWHGALLQGGSSWPTNAIVNDIQYLGNLFVAVGNDGLVLTSADGKTWSIENSGTTENLYAVAGWGLQ